MSTHYKNREPGGGCGGCLAVLVVIVIFAATAGVCWELGAMVARALVA
ncbi:MAG: hypothetical protein RSB98_00915 [Raoultibacter sp.]